jgi:hypothetical protein
MNTDQINEQLPWIRHLIYIRQTVNTAENFHKSLENEHNTLLKISPLYPELPYLKKQTVLISKVREDLKQMYDLAFDKIYSLDKKDIPDVIQSLIDSHEKDTSFQLDNMNWLNTPR